MLSYYYNSLIGHFNAIAENVTATCYITGHAENDTLIMEHLRVIPTIEKLKIHFEDFFEGNAELSKYQILSNVAPFSFILFFRH